MSYCPLAFRELYADSNGNYRLCCHAKESPHNANEMNPTDFWKSDYMENIRNEMFSGNVIPECYKCSELEEYGGWSFRNKAIELYGLNQEQVKLSLYLHMLGSYCNLSCVACHPFNSSTRRNELRNSEYKKYFNFKPKGITKNRWTEISNDIINNIDLIRSINFSGGEPFLIDRHWNLVNNISEEKAKNITLQYDTNLTSLTYKNNSIFDLKNKFKDVKLKISCDHYGEKLRYLRYPIDIEEFENNIKMVSHFDSRIHVTVNILNIHELYEIKNHYDIPVFFPSIVSNPAFLSVRNLSNEYKEKYRTKYKNESIILSEINKPPIDNWKNIATGYLNQLYGKRKMNWKNFFLI